MITTIRRAEYFELVVLFFIHAMAMSMWAVPLAAVLDAHGMASFKPYAFATSAVAAFISPLIFGAMADRHASPVVVLRGLALASAGAAAVLAAAIQLGWSPWLVLGAIQLYFLCSAPTFSISTTIVFSRLRNSQREFGPLRAMATFGWMMGCWIVSALNADASPVAGWAGAVGWLAVGAFTFLLPSVPPPEAAGKLTLRQRMGWDALALLKNPDHRVIFITAALFSATMAALLPFAPTHLRELGFQRTTAWMSTANIAEVIALFGLAGLFARVRLKWIFATGLGIAIVRNILCAVDEKWWLITGIILHGAAFTLVLITAQIYLDERVDTAWRARAQALMALMTTGVGSLVGHLGSGWWFNACTDGRVTRWPVFWGGLAVAMGLVLTYFLAVYRGRGLKRAGEGNG